MQSGSKALVYYRSNRASGDQALRYTLAGAFLAGGTAVSADAAVVLLLAGVFSPAAVVIAGVVVAGGVGLALDRLGFYDVVSLRIVGIK